MLQGTFQWGFRQWTIGGIVGGIGHAGVVGGGLVGAAAPVASVNGLTFSGINWG